MSKVFKISDVKKAQDHITTINVDLILTVYDDMIDAVDIEDWLEAFLFQPKHPFDFDFDLSASEESI